MKNQTAAFVIALKGNDTDIVNIKKYLPNVRRFDAIDTRNDNLQTLPVHPAALAGIQKTYFSDSFQLPSKGAIGCALSHYAIWKHCLDNKHPVVVMEEDVTFEPHVASALMGALSTLPRDAMYATLIHTPYSVWNCTSPDRRLIDSVHDGWYELNLVYPWNTMLLPFSKRSKNFVATCLPGGISGRRVYLYGGIHQPELPGIRYQKQSLFGDEIPLRRWKSTIGYQKFSVRTLLPESNWFYGVYVA